MLFNVICNNFQYSYQSQSMIFDIPLIYNIFSKARNHIDITHPYNFPSISKIFFSRWKLYFITCVIALHFFSFYYFSFRWNVEKIEYSHWLQPKTFRSFMIDNGIRFQNWYSLYRVTITYNVHVHSSLLSVSTRCASFSLIEQTRYVIFREVE